MANQKLSELTPIVSADLANDDLMLVTDTSAVESKSITIQELDSRYGGGSIGSLEQSINKVGHGFVLFDQLYVDPSGVWLPADATDAAKDNIATVIEVTDVDNFKIQCSGFAELPNAFTIGEYYWVDPASPGDVTATIPATPGQYQMPAFRVLSSTLIAILSGQRSNIV